MQRPWYGDGRGLGGRIGGDARDDWGAEMVDSPQKWGLSKGIRGGFLHIGWAGGSSRGPLILCGRGGSALRLGDGRGNLRAAKTPPLQEGGRTRRYGDSGRDAAFSNRDAARHIATNARAPERMPPRSRIWAMRQRGAARHVATNASRPIKTPPHRLIHRGLPVQDGGLWPWVLGAHARWIKMRFPGLAGARATPNRISHALRGRNPTLRHRCGRGIGGATRPLCD